MCDEEDPFWTSSSQPCPNCGGKQKMLKKENASIDVPDPADEDNPEKGREAYIFACPECQCQLHLPIEDHEASGWK